jgi:paraquat-inducible protein B
VRTEKSAAVKISSPVLFNNIKIGEVMGLTLAGKTHKINIDLLIFKKFRYLVNGSSRFYNLSGVKAEASLQGISLESGPLEAIISGGISLYNPEVSTPLADNRVFRLYKTLAEARDADGLRLTLHLHNAGNISHHTKIRYQGIVIGRIVDMRFNSAFDQVVARAVVRKEAEKLFRKDTILYLVEPRISLAGIRNLDTVLGGAYITLRPGKGEPADEFSVLAQSPGRNEIYAGLNIILESPTRGSLRPGSPLYYRQVPVGSITGYELSPTGQQVWLQANILPEYQYIIRRGTKFWNVSGIEVNGGIFSGLTISTQSMEALVRGGVALATPPGAARGEPAENGDHFPLAKKAAKAWKTWAPNLRLADDEIENEEMKTDSHTQPLQQDDEGSDDSML